MALNTLALVVLASASFALFRRTSHPSAPVATAPQVAAPAELSSATTTTATSSKASAVPKPKVSALVSPVRGNASNGVNAKKAPPQIAAAASTTADTSVATRIEHPYPTPSESSDAVNSAARAALVNILCTSRGSVRPISGSGVIIDSRGVILTNAHVAQYVLLAENPAINLSCVIRTGSPAAASKTPLQVGDVIECVSVKFKDYNIHNATDYTNVLSLWPVGTKLDKVQVRRGSQLRVLAGFVLGPAPKENKK